MDDCYMYLTNAYMNQVYVYDFFDADGTFVPVTDPVIVIPTGLNPTDVKVQKVLVEGQYQTYAYITNAGDDTVTVVKHGDEYGTAISAISGSSG